MNDHQLPSNIRQIGSISGGLKIYMEDFVYTYLNQYAESGEYSEKVAFLVGNSLVIDGEHVLFICGAIQGKYCVNEEGVQLFSDRSYFYAEEQLEKYFTGLEIVGWMQSQQGYSARLNPVYENYHMNNFNKSYQVLFVIDPVEKVNAFYVWNEEGTAIGEVPGYFIYYDKNNGMQEYMLQNRLAKYKIKEKDYEEFEDGEDLEPVKKARKKTVYPTTYTSRNQSIASKSTMSKKTGNSPRGDGHRLTNMLVTLSAVLFVICFIMGAGLIQNESRITTLEGNISELVEAYNFMQAQVKQATQTVFAGQETAASPSPQPQPTQTLPPVVVESPKPSEEVRPSTSPAVVDITEPPTEPATEPPVENTDEPYAEMPEETQKVDEEYPGDALIAQDLPDSYIIEPGDSLIAISLKFYGSAGMVERIMEANGMTDPDKIEIGKELLLPKPDVNE